MGQRGSDEGVEEGGGAGKRFRVERWGGRGARAGRREVARGRSPRRAPRRARRMDKSPAPKPQTLKPRNAGDADRALGTRRRGGPRGRGSPKRAAMRAARGADGAARANGASASAVSAVRRSNDGGRRETHPRTQAERGGAHAVIAGNAEAPGSARREARGRPADAHRGHRRGEGGHAEHRV